MSNISYDGDFTVATRISPFRTSSPFPGIGVGHLGEADYMQRFDKFRRLQLGTQYEDNGLYRLVGESETQTVGGGIAKWTRRFAMQPENRVEYESYAWRRPGYTGTVTNFKLSISGTPTTQANGNLQITVDGNHGMKVDDIAVIGYNRKIGEGNVETNDHVSRKVLSVIGVSTFEVAPILDRLAETTPYKDVAPGGISRPVETFVVSSRNEIEYHHVGGHGDMFASADAITIQNPERIVNNNNEITDSYGGNTDRTVTSYIENLVNTETWIVAEATIVRRWVGNFYEASTRKVLAQ